MPLYEYECDECGHRIEQIQRFSDPLVEKCPACGGPMRKLVSSPAIQFKGTGWYVTDYARKDQTGGDKAEPKEKAETKADAKTEGKADASTEGKPAAKGEKPAKTEKSSGAGATSSPAKSD